jgi:hypothetical protein
MSVLAEGFSIIVRRSTIDSDFPGGIAAYKRLVPNKTFCADQHLTRVGFLDWPEVSQFLERLHGVGLTQHFVNGRVDIGLVHQDQGIAALTPWLEWGRDEAGRSIAWLSGADVGQLAVPEGWSPDSALRNITDAEATESLIPLETTPSHSAFLDSRSGEVVYGLNDAHGSTDPLQDMATIKCLTDELRIIRDRVGVIFVYYFPKSWLRVIAKALRLTAQPDFARYTSELRMLRDSASRIANGAKTAFEAIATANIDAELKEAARLGYLQVFYDANWVILFDELIKAMREGNRESLKYFNAMADFARKANANLAELKREGGRLSLKYDRSPPS